MDIQHLNYTESSRYLYEFSVSEKSSVKEIATDRKNEAKYIWIVNKADIATEMDKGIGFLSYSIYPIPESDKAFIYIVKIHTLKEYRGETPITINGKRVREILFEEIEMIEDVHKKLDIDIITLVSANEKLDIFYQDLGFNDLPEGSVIEKYSQLIMTNDPIMYRIKQTSNLELSDEEKTIFGV